MCDIKCRSNKIYSPRMSVSQVKSNSRKRETREGDVKSIINAEQAQIISIQQRNENAHPLYSDLESTAKLILISSDARYLVQRTYFPSVEQEFHI